MKLQKKPIHKKYIFITLAIVTATAIAALLTYNHFKPAPTYPLGDVNKLEYIGNTGYGCWLVCDANPAEVYYYATDMSVEEVVGYFRRASVTDQTTHASTSKVIGFDKPSTSGFYLTYYLNGKEELTHNSIKTKTSKPYVLSIPAEQYKIALDSL